MITIVNGDGWVGVYRDGVILDQGKRYVDTSAVLELLEIGDGSVDGEEYLSYEYGHSEFPKLLSDLREWNDARQEEWLRRS